jgi:hypothetical protein
MHPIPRVALLATAIALAAIPSPSRAGPPAPGPTLDLRLRDELVDDAAFADNAQALTLRVRAGWRLPLGARWRGLVELEHTSHLGAEDFNSTANGRAGFPTIADADNTELNQAWLAWAPGDATQVTLGRQRLLYDNQRFIGNAGWRQNEQTFDALDAQHRTAGGWRLRYSYLDGVQRVFAGDHATDTSAHWALGAHLLNVGHALGPGSLTGYAYWIENRTLPASSHRDLGLRYTLRHEAKAGPGWFANLEFATQAPYADGRDGNDADYALAEGGMLWHGHAFKLGYELLGGDGRYGFATPLASLHAFNGWADRFTSTPAVGLDDRYLGWNKTYGKLEAAVAWHDYRSDVQARDLGDEWNASVGWRPTPHWLLLAKAADYHAGDGGADVRKTWLSVEYSH